MTTHDPRVVHQLAAVIGRATFPGWTPQLVAVDVLDALVVDDPVFRWHEDGSITVAWPAGVDPDRDPADGLQTVLTDVRLLARVVERLNEQARELAQLRQVAQAAADETIRRVKA